MDRIRASTATGVGLIRCPIRWRIIRSTCLTGGNGTVSTELPCSLGRRNWRSAPVFAGTELGISTCLLYLVRLRSYRREMSLVCK